MRYSRIKPVAHGNSAHFKNLKNFENDYLIFEGISLIDKFPEDAEYRMNNDFPDSIELQDVLHNLDNNLVVNGKIKNFIVGEKIKALEFFPMRIINHKGRKVSQPYYMVNFVKHVDCINQEKSKFEWNSLDPEKMSDVSLLHIDESKIPPDDLIFRLKHLDQVIVIREDLENKMVAQEFKGFEILKLTDFTS